MITVHVTKGENTDKSRLDAGLFQDLANRSRRNAFSGVGQTTRQLRERGKCRRSLVRLKLLGGYRAQIFINVQGFVLIFESLETPSEAEKETDIMGARETIGD